MWGGLEVRDLQIDQNLTGTRLRHVQLLNFRGDGAWLVVHCGLVLLR